MCDPSRSLDIDQRYRGIGLQSQVSHVTLPLPVPPLGSLGAQGPGPEVIYRCHVLGGIFFWHACEHALWLSLMFSWGRGLEIAIPPRSTYILKASHTHAYHLLRGIKGTCSSRLGD